MFTGLFILAVYYIITVGATQISTELKAQSLGMLTQEPGICLGAGKSCAVNTALLPGADADCLPVVSKAYRVRAQPHALRGRCPEYHHPH